MGYLKQLKSKKQMKNLLPPNSTKQEKALVDATDYKVDSSCIRGFKFNPKEEILPWLVEEYGLGEILFWVKDKRKAVKEGVKFQRLRGTPASLKIALKWANIDEIIALLTIVGMAHKKAESTA